MEFFNIDFGKNIGITVIKIIDKLKLQPLVENAIYHGIKEKRGNGKILITGKIEGNLLCFTVIDNGKGIEEDVLNKINRILTNSSEKETEMGYGIFNVNERIRLTYGEEYGLTYKSIYGQGTIVALRHPIIE